MKTYNIHQAKTHLSRLVEEAAAGEEIVIARAGKPVAKLVPISATAGPRTLGVLAGRVRERKDTWAPDADLEELFYGPVDKVSTGRVAERRRK